MRDYEIEMAFSSINFAQDRSGTLGDQYRERLAALKRLLQGGASFRYFREFRPNHFLSLPKAKLTARDLAEAAKAGRQFAEAEDGTIEMGTSVVTTGLQIPLPHEGQTAVDLAVLGLTPGKALYPVRPPTASRPDSVGLQSDTLWLAPRTAAELLDLGTFCVEVPEPHRSQGIVPPETALLNSSVRLPLRIQHATEEPSSDYRIRHRGYWFFVDDADIASKRIFRMMVVAFQSRIGAVAAEGGPTLSLPIGGF
jgi:hypothetical protein